MKLDSAVFYTNDLAKVVAFYQNISGFKINYIQDGQFASFIFENSAKLGLKRTKEEREVPGHQTAFLTVTDIERFYEAIKNKTAIHKELVEQDWSKNFSILDPDGNKIQFVEYT